MWDLPGPGLESMSPALAGGFLTTAPPEKSPHFLLFCLFYMPTCLPSDVGPISINSLLISPQELLHLPKEVVLGSPGSSGRDWKSQGRGQGVSMEGEFLQAWLLWELDFAPDAGTVETLSQKSNLESC